jgi:hypothetical protein
MPLLAHDFQWHELGLVSGFALNVCALLLALRTPSREIIYSAGPASISTTTTSPCISQLQEALDWRATAEFWRTVSAWLLSLWLVTVLLLGACAWYYLHFLGRKPDDRGAGGRSISSSAKPLRGARDRGR